MDNNKAPNRGVGGSANARGIDFQARVTAIVMANMLTERKLGWVDKLFEDVPIEVNAETGGYGDDIGIKLINGFYVEAQVKRGLTKGKDLWDVLLSLADGILNKQINAGILVTCPNSSKTISNILAEDIIRIGTGRKDGLRDIGQEFLDKLLTKSIDPAEVCSLIRIITISAVEGNRESENAAKERLLSISASDFAWEKLINYSRELIEIRGKVTLTLLVKFILISGIQIKLTSTDTKIQFQSSLNKWLDNKLSKISLLGLQKPIPFEKCWISLKAISIDLDDTENLELEHALKTYHEYAYNRNSESYIDAYTIGRYVKTGVILGGPGIGKSTLLKKLALAYSKDGYLVLLVKLPQVSQLMKSNGLRFEDCLITSALSSSGIPSKFISLHDAVILADALDECGSNQSDITSELQAFKIAHPATRIIVTSRPIGYQSGSIGDWRHYELQPLESEEAKNALGKILEVIPFQSDEKRVQAIESAKSQIEKGFIKDVAARSPLMLTLIAALVAKDIEPHGNRSSLYRQLFQLIEDHPPAKLNFEIPSEPERNRFLEILGWTLLINGNEGIEKSIEHCQHIWMKENVIGRIECLKTIDGALKYWETLGIIERVRTHSQTAITFVHKTFGEFAAALYIFDSPESNHKSLLIQVIKTETWKETLSFASHLGLANLIIESWTELTKDFQNSFDFTFDEAIELVLLSGASFKQETILAFAEFCWQVLQNTNSRARYVSGDALCTLSQSHWELIRDEVLENLNSKDTWIKLVSWACLCISSEKNISQKDLINVISTPEKAWPNLTGNKGIMFSVDGRVVRDSFYIGVARRILKAPIQNDVLEAFNNFIAISDNLNVGQMVELEKMYHKAKHKLPNKITDYLERLPIPPNFITEWDKGLERFVNTLDDPSIVVNIQVHNPETMYEFGALLSGSRIWKMPLDFILEFKEDVNQIELNRYVLFLVAKALNIDTNILVQQVRSIKMRIANNNQEIFSLLSSIPNLDVESDFDSLDINIDDISNLEEIILNEGQFLGMQACEILFTVMHTEYAIPLLTRLLDKGKNTSLKYAAILSQSLPPIIHQSLILDRLILKDLNYGCKYLYEYLLPPFSTRHVDAIFKGLKSNSASIAKVASSHLENVPISKEIINELRIIYDEWKIKEKPYPVNGGVIPDSPRDNISKVFAKHLASDKEVMFAMAQDSRSDINREAEKPLIKLLIGSEELQDIFIAKILNGELQPKLLKYAITSNVFNKTSAHKILPLLSSNVTKIRFFAMQILDESYISKEILFKEIDKLLTDSDIDIREYVHKLKFFS